MEEDIKYWLGVLKADNFNNSFIELVENLIARNKELEELLEEKTIRVGFENKEDYISKSKVRELIEKYKGFGWHNKDDEYWANRILDGFEELLQEGDDK